MNLNNLKIINFRNYEELYLNFNDKINLFIGRNGQGKTNIIEAIYLLSIGKSFRTNKDKEMIKFNKDSGYIGGSFLKESRNNLIEIGLSKNNKKGIKINKVYIEKISQLLGNLNIVIFSPEDLRLVKEGPKERRNFIDREISQIIPKYYSFITNYNKILLQRNKLLKEVNIDDNLLDVYDENLVNYGSYIYIYRREFIEKIKSISKDIHYKLTDEIEALDIVYKNQIEIKFDNSLDEIREKFSIKLKNNRKNDKEMRITKIGPHKDDIDIYINKLNVKLYGSQGQQRTASISLKLSEIELINKEVGEYPILLLDDIFSELDENRQKLLVNNLNQVQMFITTAEHSHRNIFQNKSVTVFNIEQGNVLSIE